MSPAPNPPASLQPANAPIESIAPFSLVEHMWERVQREAEESDASWFEALLGLFEFTLKLTTAGFVAAIETERDGHRYRLEHGLVRADGLGAWESALSEVLTGPANAFLSQRAWADAEAVTATWNSGDSTWQRSAIQLMDDACRILDPGAEPLARRSSLLMWFRRGVWLRNRTRGHGALTAAQKSRLASPLSGSIRQVTDNLPLFQRPWVVIRRTQARRKYHVVRLGGDTRVLDYLKSRRDIDLSDGVYVYNDGPICVRLVSGDVDLADFFLPNGNYREESFEGLSYVTGATRRQPIADFSAPPSPLPSSATEGLSELDVQGDTFGNVPPLAAGYVRRPDLEHELGERLRDSRYPAVTLVGRGGIGKTSLALQVLHEITVSGVYETVVWFSARDIELDPDRARTVRPQVKGLDEIAVEFDRLLHVGATPMKGKERVKFLADHLGGVAETGPILFVFDNFETVVNPIELYDQLSNWIRLPNKILITTRLRPFKGDYPVEVKGMSQSEMEELIDSHATRLGITAKLSKAVRREVFTESEGHPYVAKILLGEIARRGGRPLVQRILANRDDILSALFERTYSSLPSAAQRAFLTLCSWRSAVPVVALQAVMLRPTNERIPLDDAVDALVLSSMVDLHPGTSPSEDFLSVPLYAALFGRQKLKVSPFEPAVEADTKLLQLFGATRAPEITGGLAPRVDALVRQIADKISNREGDDRLSELNQFLPVIEYVASRYPPTWLRLAELYELADPTQTGVQATKAIERYLQSESDDPKAWSHLAALAGRTGDYLTEVHALLKRAERAGAPFVALSFAANRFNQLLGDGRLTLDTEEKRVIAERLRKLMEGRLGEANATDLSRLGWLCMHLRDQVAARTYAARGLELDPHDFHCANLLDRVR